MGFDLAPLQNLIDQFERMQGIGHKTAQRMAFYVLGLSDEQAREFAQAITDAHPQVLINVRVTPQGKEKYNNNEYIISAVQQAEMELMGEGRVLVRVSGTEPLIRVMLEGSDLDKITALGNKIADVVKERLS